MNVNSIKLVVTDLDNTLLRRDKTISDYTVDVFRRVRERGMLVAFATARPIRAVQSLGINIEANAAIYHNGAVIAIGGAVHRHIGIDYITAKNLLLQTVGTYGNMQVAVEIEDVLYANFDVTKVWTNTTAIMTDFTDLPAMPADKIIVGTADRKIISEIEKSLPDDIYAEITENRLLMLMNKNARKINAIIEIASHFSITLAETAAFGDDYNDIEMLRECGIGVAAKNAIDECKAVADYVCGDCDEDGVAKWLEEKVL
ncbi:MAG: HAD-IIB family hydrolase [Oscillospiraceae bacterium]|nr:HAD-IIB family hydrolase [Oscillospiraceae bacterium]